MTSAAVSPVPRPPPQAKGHEKFLSAKIPCNPLISLDSDERIQGNPRESKADNRVVCPQIGREPRKFKCIGWTDAPAGCRESHNPLLLEIKRALVVGAGSLGRLHVIERARRRLLGGEANRPRIVKRPLGAGMKLGSARRYDRMH